MIAISLEHISWWHCLNVATSWLTSVRYWCIITFKWLMEVFYLYNWKHNRHLISHKGRSVFLCIIGQFMCAKASKGAVNPPTVSTGSGNYSCNQVQYKHSLTGIHAAGIAGSLWPTHGMHDNLLVREGSPSHTTPSGIRQNNKYLTSSDKHI